MEITNLESLMAKLRDKAARANKTANVQLAVGYTARYAKWVHENMEPKTLDMGVDRPSGLGHYWGPSQYGPKFLTGPLYEYERELSEIVTNALRGGKTLAQALLLAGLKLQRESQLRVPVEFGFLKASAFTRLEKGEE